MLETITSAANPLLKDVRRAIARGGLTRQGWCVAETLHLLEEALRSDLPVNVALVAESALSEARPLVEGLKCAILPDALFPSISGTEAPQGIMALVTPPEWRHEDLFHSRAPDAAPLLLVLDELQDPGNAGAMVRAAEAFGAGGIIFLKGTASPYNPKTLRASAGSLFRVPVAHGMDFACARAMLADHAVEVFAAVPPQAGSLPADACDLRGSCAIVIGNEARGVSASWRAAARQISIPTRGVESLNAALAAGILLYEARRQRTARA